MQLLSNWTLTFDRSGTPLVLVEPGMRIEGELGFPWQESAQESSRIGATLGERRARGNASTRVRVTAIREHESDAAARLWCLQLQPTLNTYSGVTSTLMIQAVAGSTRHELGAAVLESVETRLRPGAVARTETTYELAGSAWEALPTPGVHPLPSLHVEMIAASDAQWFEVSFISPEPLTGTPSGWTWAGPPALSAYIEQSTDLMIWEQGKFVDAPGSPVEVDGGWEYTARSTVPARWNAVMVDLTLTSNRSGKAITGIEVKGVPVSLPGYPYSMPAQTATLQTHLRAAGFTGATVASVAAPLSVQIRNHLQSGTSGLQATVAGGAVTQVRYPAGGGVWNLISLPGYPYALPSAAPTLQTHLRAAGYTGAVVKLLGPEWAITIPNVLAGANNRSLTATITPGDPFPAWDTFGTYLGLVPDNAAQGSSGNVRTPAGAPLLEAPRQFARLRVLPQA